MMRLIVDTQGARLRKVGNRLLVQREGETIQSLPIEPLQQVILMGQGVSASTPLLVDLVRRGVDVVYQSQAQRFAFRLVGPLSKHSALRVRQVQVAQDAHRSLALARAAVAGKLHNQAVVLRRLGLAGSPRGQAAIQTLVSQMTKSSRAENLDSLRGYEGSGAAAYFGVWPALFDAARWDFKGRAYHPPPDPVNAMLSLGYTLLLNDIIGAVYRIGLDPAIGFFHTIDYGRPSLALDVEEEFRPVIVDTLVLSVLRENLLQPGDFDRPKGGGAGVVMSDDARRFFIARYQERLEVKVRHPAADQQLSYAQCIDRQLEHMARCILGRDRAYSPLLIQ
jgi:CRISPR-associated protein Cas1